MGIEAKLRRWQAAGLIDDATRQRIETFERSNDKPVLLYALAGLGALTIGIGIISIVAANWDDIDKSVKLGLDLLVGALLSYGIYRSVSRHNVWVTQVLLGIHYLFVLASLALIGQVYQLGSPTHHALLAWSLSTAPLMLLTRTPLLGFLWLSGLMWTEIDTSVFYLERLDDRWDDALTGNVAATWTTVLMLGNLSLARVPWFARERPHVSATWTSTLWVTLVGSALTLCFAFYSDMYSDVLTWSLITTGLLIAGFASQLRRLYPALPSRALLGVRMILGITWLVFALSTGFVRGELQAVGASAQVVLLAITAWTVLQLGSVRLFNVLTGLIGLRVLCMYFEVFGSMLDTGLGMISGGVLTLLLAWVWKRKSPELAARLTSQGGNRAA